MPSGWERSRAAEAPAPALRPPNDPQDPGPQTQIVFTSHSFSRCSSCLSSKKHLPRVDQAFLRLSSKEISSNAGDA